jgi:hypothetical protein
MCYNNLLIYFRGLVPLHKHFFHVKLVDGTKKYRPESQIVLDIGTAYNFFGRDPERTKSIVCKKVHNLVDAWNDKYIVKKEVNLKEFNLPY